MFALSTLTDNNLLKFSTTEENVMATVNFSVPEDVKDAFNNAYQGQNKSAVIAELMREAVERAVRKQQHQQAIANVLARRAETTPATVEELCAAREELRS
jgi:metal-responsive CopG/Arc/MetJ family transcriptional regulator